jgi:signal peptidase II
MTRKFKIVLFCTISILLIGGDQISKQLAKQHLKDRPVQSFLHDSFRLDYVENTGAFLSLGADWSPGTSFWVLNMLPLLFLVILLVYALRKTATLSFIQLFPYLLIASGGLGNIIDRILYNRHVTDFMNIGIGNFRTGIFNVADLYVTSGVIMLLLMARRQP